MYTVIATTAHNRRTLTYNNLADAVHAAYWYGWDMSAKVTDATGRIIIRCGSGICDSEPTDSERQTINAVHLQHYSGNKHCPKPVTEKRETSPQGLF